MKTDTRKLTVRNMSGHGIGVHLLTLAVFVGGPLSFGVGRYFLSESLPDGRQKPKLENIDPVSSGSEGSSAAMLEHETLPKINLLKDH